MDWKEWRNFLKEEKEIVKEISVGKMTGVSVPEALAKLDRFLFCSIYYWYK